MSQKLETLEQLYSIAEEQKDKDVFFELIELLISAMTDWPTQNLNSIEQFTSEVANYFGQPITAKRLNSFTFDGNNTWQLESSSSLIELLVKSSQIAEFENLQDVISKLMEHYETCS